MINSPTVAISTQDHMLAALLFDYIVPMHSFDSVPSELNIESVSSFKIPKMPLDEVEAIKPRLIKQYYTDLKKGRLTEIIEQIKHDKLTNKLISDGVDEETAIRSVYLPREVDNYFIPRVHKALRESNIRSVPIFQSTPSYKKYLPAGQSNAVEITLTNTRVIDTSKLEWEHVLELRKDKDFFKRLRNFRLFLNENYQGKDINYIQDHLQKKLDDYEESCRKHGIQLVLSTISQTLDSKSLLGSLAIVTACILTGNPTVSSLGIISGTSIEVGKLIVNIMQKKLEYDEKVDNTELSYLFKLEKHIKK